MFDWQEFKIDRNKDDVSILNQNILLRMGLVSSKKLYLNTNTKFFGER